MGGAVYGMPFAEVNQIVRSIRTFLRDTPDRSGLRPFFCRCINHLHKDRAAAPTRKSATESATALGGPPPCQNRDAFLPAPC